MNTTQTRKGSDSPLKKSVMDLMSKVLYLKFNMDAIKEDPKYWESLPHEKQVELHELKAELDAFFKEIKN
jgi:hypothetical protein